MVAISINTLTAISIKIPAKLTKKQLIGQIIELHQKYKDVKTYYEYFTDSNNNTVIEKLNRIIRNEFFPKKNSIRTPYPVI